MNKNNSLTPLNINHIKNPKGLTMAEKVSFLEEERIKVRELFSKLDLALAKQKITIKEYDYLLQKYTAGNHEYKLMQAIDKQIINLQKEKEHRKKQLENTSNAAKLIVASLAIIMLLIIGGITFNEQILNGHSGITGLSTYVDKIVTQTKNIEITENTTIDVNSTNITSLKLTGSLKGLGTAKTYLEIGGETLLITEQSTLSDQQSSLIKTDKSIYLSGEQIIVNIEGASLNSEINNSTNSTNSTDFTDPTDSMNSTNSTTNSTMNATTNTTTNTTIQTINTPTYTLYKKSDTTTTLLTSNEFTIQEPGVYEIYALIDDQGTITKESKYIQIVDSVNDITKNFEAVCENTCNLDPNKIPTKIKIVLDKNVSLTINKIIYTTKAENSLPVQIKKFSDLTLTKGMNTTLDLNDYFKDPDGQQLLYDYSSEKNTSANNGAGITITNNLLKINPVMAGTYDTTIYASDLSEMIESNSFKINVIEIQTETSQNETDTNINSTFNYTNQTSTIQEPPTNTLLGENTNTSINQTNINVTNSSVVELEKLGLCDNVDPNKVPASCLLQNDSYYFVEEGKFLENLDKKKVARITTIGNLLITGDVYEKDNSKPGNRDFKIGYTNNNFEFIPTLWIDSKTGDLHLTGSLHEEIINLELPSNVYSFQNKRGVNLGYANPKTGDLYIRGNLIPYRRSLE